ncbi:MAG: hypothetical protein HW380_3326 [Magnetococcales bacterium]|nr:hypothetical protein [Magnetococcales bacterium]HIJ83289.1 hypothetical protein [Magnetococcales bacterium]
MSRSSLENNATSIQGQMELLYQALIKVPCGTGDHTDLCRMHNQGLPPLDNDQCRCHVGAVRIALANYRSWKEPPITQNAHPKQGIFP